MRSYFKGLLFDNDGVLVDSMPGAISAWRQWGEKYYPGFELTAEHHGKRAQDLVLQMVGENLFKEADDYINNLEQDLAHLTVPLEGSVEFLTSMKPGVWTVVTSANPNLARGRLGAAGIPIPNEIVTAWDVENGKPHPEPYLKGAANLGFDISDCVVFEDAQKGVEAAKNGGFYCIGIGDAATLSLADQVVNGLYELV
jgi:sugar-phosphatase